MEEPVRWCWCCCGRTTPPKFFCSAPPSSPSMPADMARMSALRRVLSPSILLPKERVRTKRTEPLSNPLEHVDREQDNGRTNDHEASPRNGSSPVLPRRALINKDIAESRPTLCSQN